MGGADYGPRLIAKNADFTPDNLQALKKIAIPGKNTSAALSLQIMLREQSLEPELVVYDFKDVSRAILEGEVDAGVIIHEGQLTFQNSKLHLLSDLGEWWHKKTSLPLPLGINVISNKLDKEAQEIAAGALFKSIKYSLDNREQALDYAMKYARGISREDADTFVGMYVNDLTLNIGNAGKESITLFLTKAFEHKLIPQLPEMKFIDPKAL